jgi:hypothetical protein
VAGTGHRDANIFIASATTNSDDTNMEHVEHEFSDYFREQDRVSQLPPKQKALWHLQKDIQMFEDLKSGRGEAARLALWIIEGINHVDKILPRGSPERMELDSAMSVLFSLVKDFVADFNRRMFLPAIDAATAILLHCKVTLESWTDENAAEKLSATMLRFPAT